MATLQTNKQLWDGAYDWSQSGDEWSSSWGGPSVQWHGSIFPRIHRFLPGATILEIACGFGRWTHYLKDHCERLIAIDLSEQCIEGCRKRLAGYDHISYFVNDGKSLDMVEDGSVDFVFSYDSLVHADEAAIRAYLAQFPRILKTDGVAFIHHSNLGEYEFYRTLAKIPRLPGILHRLGLMEYLHFRDHSVSARKVERFAEESGLQCISQEINTWLTRRTMIDCLSTIVKKGSRHARENQVMRNAAFSREADYLVKLSRLYGPRAAAETSE